MKQCKKVRSLLLRAPIMVVTFNLVTRLLMQVFIIIMAVIKLCPYMYNNRKKFSFFLLLIAVIIKSKKSFALIWSFFSSLLVVWLCRKYLFSSFAAVNAIFLAINISSAFFCPRQDAHEMMVIVRVVINGFLFVLVGIVLCFCIIKVCYWFF